MPRHARFYERGEQSMNVPRHVAIILDGNGRWAKSKGMPRTYGHVQGAKNVENICRAAHDLGIEYLTLYAFSTENWNRPDEEVAALMRLLRNYLKTCLSTAKKNNMRIRAIGDISALDDDIRTRIAEVEEASASYDGLNLTIAINYGSRDEIMRAVARICSEAAAGELSADQIDEDLIASYLDTAGIPDPDLMIRTSGEQRLSNYLLWQLAYTEFYFTETPWPAFGRKELEEALNQYALRERRYGGV